MSVPPHPDTKVQRGAREQAFVSALGPLRREILRVFDKELSPFGISSALAWPLLVIQKQGGMRQRELAEILEIEGPTLVRSLDQLEAMGMVERRTDTGDCRAKTLHLKAAGSTLAKKIRAAIDRRRSGFFANISDADIDTCMRVFASLSRAMANDASREV